MSGVTYLTRREELRTYFDRTAVEAWRRLTSNEPVGGIRATVRAGRNAMRATLISWLPERLHGARILDAGCGSGALAVDLARRGAEVVAVDISPTLVNLARERAPDDLGAGRVDWRVGDMLDPAHGAFDYVVAMDSLIHYEGADIARVLAELGARTSTGVLFTVAPRTPALALMHAVGRLFPRGDRAPAIAPISARGLARAMSDHAGLESWRIARSHRVSRGFYISQAVEARKA
jgi:magnesium-protoporphyrin O-methyltransferase